MTYKQAAGMSPSHLNLAERSVPASTQLHTETAHRQGCNEEEHDCRFNMI